MKSFRLSTTHVKFHQICFWISSFYRKYKQFQLKKYRIVMSHYTEEWCKIWRKTDLLFQKMTRIWWILIRALESLKNLPFHWFLLYKVYNVWPISTGELSFMTLKNDAKSDLWFEKWHDEFSKFPIYRGIMYTDTEEW